MIYKKDKASYCANKPKDCFDYLRQFIGKKLRIKKRGEDFRVCTKYGVRVLLTSDRTIERAVHLTRKDYEERLQCHSRHNLRCVCYGGNVISNIAIECEDCYTVLYDVDNPRKN